MFVKGLGLVLGLLLLALVGKSLSSSEPNAPPVKKKEVLSFEGCLPVVKLKREQLLLSEGLKENQALSLCESAENRKKNLSQDPEAVS